MPSTVHRPTRLSLLSPVLIKRILYGVVVCRSKARRLIIRRAVFRVEQVDSQVAFIYTKLGHRLCGSWRFAVLGRVGRNVLSVIKRLTIVSSPTLADCADLMSAT